MTVPFRGSRLEAEARKAAARNLKANRWVARFSTIPALPKTGSKRKKAK